MKRYTIPLTIIALLALGLMGQRILSQKKAKASQAFAVQQRQALAGATTSAGTLNAGAAATTSMQAATHTGQTAQTTNSSPKASLNEMSSVLAEAIRGSKNLDGVVQRLKQTGQNPFVTRDANPATGEMMIVRTKSPLPGTRYFHAQYFTDENNQRFVQHMSFEFKPGPTSMNDAVHAAVQNFSVGEPSQRKADFIQWDLDENYVLWIKKKSAKDLQNDPFNAHDPKVDVGTVQMTVELKIHDDDDDSSGHGH